MSDTKTVPAGAKKPQDHKPKTETEDGKRVVEVRGEKFTIEADAFDDFELLDDLSALEDGDATKLPGVLRRLVGKDQYAQALDLARDEDTGRVSIEAGAELVSDMLGAAAPN
ncbi:hypothetical protein EEW87_004240 [Janibacter melonis]|uniref:Tail assembly chaperone n=1 Tax=Janibacter melonis TaxID=262209 RepID=A0A5P8FKA6_9MICO|nr:hypothetical protein [Janibacter melonis]QFQ29708.2 hypothetical protein EEW87_004240 [Janibacter melonis]